MQAECATSLQQKLPGEVKAVVLVTLRFVTWIFPLVAIKKLANQACHLTMNQDEGVRP
jgi:hypothetical protein